MPRVYPPQPADERVACACCGREVGYRDADCTLTVRRTDDGLAEWTCSACVDGPGDPDFPGEDR